MDESSDRRRGKKSQVANGKAALHDDYADVFDHQMELDEQLGAGVSSRPTTRNGSGGLEFGFGYAMDTSEDSTGEVSFDTGKLLDETIQYGQELRGEFSNDPRREVKRDLENTLALIAYDNPKESSLRELLEQKGRVPIAEELNGAILGELSGDLATDRELANISIVALGKSASAALERMVQQTEVMLQELGDTGGSGSFIHLRTDFLEPR
jgi:Ran-binding protein 9/10